MWDSEARKFGADFCYVVCALAAAEEGEAGDGACEEEVGDDVSHDVGRALWIGDCRRTRVDECTCFEALGQCA